MDRKLVVVVESDAEVRQLIRLTLDFGPYDICEVDDVATAWQLINGSQPDAVLLAAQVGDQDGCGLARRIKADLRMRRTFVVLLAASGAGAVSEGGDEIPADAILVKPFSPLDLIDAIESLPVRAS